MLLNDVKWSLQCRYTLQYTYPYAYYMESGPRKKLVSAPLLYCQTLFESFVIPVHPASFPSLCVLKEALRLYPVWEGSS